MKKQNIKKYFLFTLVYFASSATYAAAGSLMLFPTRAIFKNNTRAIQIDLTNTGSEPASYRITLENRRMTELGQFIPAIPPMPGELSADKIIQYSPRQVELPPGGGQTVRIILRKPVDLAVGEYRTHMVFNRLPNPKAKSLDNEDKQESGIGITLTPLIGASIPIIVENGETTASTSLKNLKYIKAKKNEPSRIEVRIERSGNRSVYGDFKVKFAPKDGGEKDLATVKGVAVYAPYPSRLAKITLQNDEQKPLVNGKLVVEFSETREAGGKILSETSIEIP